MGRHADVGLEQPVGAILVGNPVLVEEDHPVEQAQLLGQPPGRGDHPELWRVPVWVGGAHEDQAQLRVAAAGIGHSADQRQRVQPVVDRAGEQDQVVVADPRDHPAHGGRPLDRRFLGKAKGDQVDQRAHRGVAGEGLRIDPVERAQGPNPVIELLLARAQKIIAEPQLVVDHGQCLVPVR